MKKYKQTKKLYSRKYRKEHPEKIQEYAEKTVEDRVKRIQARRKVKAKKGKEIHHKDGNPKNNSRSNLKVVKKHHGGGRKTRKYIKMGSKRIK